MHLWYCNSKWPLKWVWSMGIVMETENPILRHYTIVRLSYLSLSHSFILSLSLSHASVLMYAPILSHYLSAYHITHNIMLHLFPALFILNLYISPYPYLSQAVLIKFYYSSFLSLSYSVITVLFFSRIIGALSSLISAAVPVCSHLMNHWWHLNVTVNGHAQTMAVCTRYRWCGIVLIKRQQATPVELMKTKLIDASISNQ